MVARCCAAFPCCAALRKMSVMSARSSPPDLSKNLNPFRLKGRWLAVIIIEPSKFVSSNTVPINIAGVVASEQRTMVTRCAASPSTSACSSASPESRESRPIPITSVSALRPVFAASQRANAAPMFRQTSSVKFTCSPSTPSSATPRISLPFCSFKKSFSFIVYIIAKKWIRGNGKEKLGAHRMPPAQSESSV